MMESVLWLSLLVVICTAQFSIGNVSELEGLFKKVQIFNGKIASQLQAILMIECSSHCLSDKRCKVFQYRKKKQDNCILIHDDTTQTGKTFVDDNPLYKKVSPYITEVWIPPPSWTSGLLPAVYRSFDYDKYIELENGAQFLDGKVSTAVIVNHTESQWVSLGNLSSLACLVVPNSCGSTGGALSVWINILECQYRSGIITSLQLGQEGIVMFCLNNDISYGVALPGATLYATAEIVPNEWYHVVFNFINPRIVAYHDGVEVVDTDQEHDFKQTAGMGLVEIGRYQVLIDDPAKYTSVIVDELMFFNRKLTPEEIQILYNQHN